MAYKQDVDDTSFKLSVKAIRDDLEVKFNTKKRNEDPIQVSGVAMTALKRYKGDDDTDIVHRHPPRKSFDRELAYAASSLTVKDEEDTFCQLEDSKQYK